MSVQLFSASAPGGNHASLQETSVGGSKPLHRFIRGQPKTVGIIVLALGLSLFIVSVNTTTVFYRIWTTIPPVLLIGTLFLISGILFILSEHFPTKKLVTASLALSVVTILFAFWCVLQIISNLQFYQFSHYHYFDENGTDNDDMDWSSYATSMGMCLEGLFLFYALAGIIIFIIMSSLAGAALRSTKSQAIVVMTAVPT